MTSWPEVADTAVKVGLGALIGGVFGALAPFILMLKETVVERRSRRLRYLEEALLKLDRYFSCACIHAANVVWYRSDGHQEGDETFSAAKRDYEKSLLLWEEQTDALNAATLRLQLLGKDEIIERLRLANELIDESLMEFERGGEYDAKLVLFKSFKMTLRDHRKVVAKKLREAFDDEPEIKRLIGDVGL